MWCATEMTEMLQIDPAACYEGVIFSTSSQRIMKEGKILTGPATAASMISSLLSQLARVEHRLGEQSTVIDNELSRLYDFIKRGICILGTPLLTNTSSGRPTLSSCASVPIAGVEITPATLALAESYYRLNMGSGYNLTALKDPVAALLSLNEHAELVEASGDCERYVGNMAHVSIDHPRVLEFIRAKTRHRGVIHFNTSIDITSRYMTALLNDAAGGTKRRDSLLSTTLWDELVHCAWECGDPGIISLARYNQGNPLRDVSPYITVAPCAEVGLAAGECCVFGYINLAACLQPGTLDLDLNLIGDAAECLTRILDDSLELSLDGYPSVTSGSVMAANRKIGIGICGFADMLMWKGVDYGSPKSRDYLRDALATINFRSKRASLHLALKRGPFPQFPFSRFVSERGFIRRFSRAGGKAVSVDDWEELERQISDTGLRNVMTTALPPSGRAARLLGVNPSVEPYWSMKYEGDVVPPVRVYMGAGLVKEVSSGEFVVVHHPCKNWPEDARDQRSLFRCASDIDYTEHFSILEIAAQLVDDGVSKTINLPPSAQKQTVDAIFRHAWDSGLKALSIYRIT
jgi:ribonucleoside-diphosphate reductase alpha chain